MKFIVTSFLLACTLSSPNVLAVCSTSFMAITKPSSLYTINAASGTVTDSQTGLVWQQCTLGLSGGGCNTGAMGIYTWSEALLAANESTLGGHSDWRLPNKNELSSLTDSACENPTINAAVFPNSAFDPEVISAYWSSSTFAGDANNAWMVGHYSGVVVDLPKTDAGLVRLVRSGRN